MDLLYARAQMGLSLAFHIVFASAGVALPVLMLVADFRYGRTKDPDYRRLSEKLAKGTAVLFAVGAVSGTVLSFELGLLWPRFMGTFGEAIGLPFTLEGFAFFTEAIFLGIYLYGRERVSRGLHLFSGAMVALSGAASAFFVTLVNAFMNNPVGFHVRNGVLTDVDALQAMFSPGWATETVHALLASYQATAFAMLGIHALVLLRRPQSAFHQKALQVAFPLACLCAIVQPLVGDRSAKQAAQHQPVKLAALEGQFTTQRAAPLRVGGFPDAEVGETRWALEIPGGLSFLAHGDLRAEVKGLREFARDEWPPVEKVHASFQVMVGAGTLMAWVALAALLQRLRRRPITTPPFLLAFVGCGPLGWVALEAGWLVTEYGRQPWVVKGVLRTADAVTPFTPLLPTFYVFTAVYVALSFIVVYLLGRQIAQSVPSPVEGAVHAGA
jgi:cytochrome d ubiquinol oxidase subunit I